MKKILVVDDEENIRFSLKRFLSDEGYAVSEAEGYDEAVRLLKEERFDLVFADIMLQGKSGMDLLHGIKELGRKCLVVMITGVPSVKTAAEAVRLGAFDYLSKPLRQGDLVRVAATALKHKAALDEKEKLRANLTSIFQSVRDGIITVDKGMRVIEINGAAEEICGIGRDKLVESGLSAAEIQCAGACLDVLEKAIRENTHVKSDLLRCGRKGREKQVVSLSAGPLLGLDGSLGGGVLTIRDETRLASLENDMKERSRFHKFVGKSRAMQEIYTLISRLADVRSTVLVTGESGTGKELAAEALHYMGAASDNPLVKVNCATLTESLLESELFGHVKGAFSGAVKNRDGRFKLADGGTLFLDEIGEISPRTQVALLRVLQEKEFERVGDAVPIKVDVRVVAATNRDLKEEVEKGRFRRDLYYRLKVMELTLPPLRERREDIPLLAEHFRVQFNRQMGKEILGISDRVMELFLGCEWIGNVREFKHVMEHAFILCSGNTLLPEHLPREVKMESGPVDEKERIRKALEEARWNKTRAAEILGMSRQHLYRKFKEFNIKM